MDEDEDNIVAALRRGEDGWEYAAADEIEALRAENERLLESNEYYKNKDAKNGQDISNLVSKTAKLREALKQIHDAVDFPEDTLRRKIRAARAAYLGEKE